MFVLVSHGNGKWPPMEHLELVMAQRLRSARILYVIPVLHQISWSVWRVHLQYLESEALEALAHPISGSAEPTWFRVFISWFIILVYYEPGQTTVLCFELTFGFRRLRTRFANGEAMVEQGWSLKSEWDIPPLKAALSDDFLPQMVKHQQKITCRLHEKCRMAFVMFLSPRAWTHKKIAKPTHDNLIVVYCCHILSSFVSFIYTLEHPQPPMVHFSSLFGRTRNRRPVHLVFNWYARYDFAAHPRNLLLQSQRGSFPGGETLRCLETKCWAIDRPCDPRALSRFRLRLWRLAGCLWREWQAAHHHSAVQGRDEATFPRPVFGMVLRLLPQFPWGSPVIPRLCHCGCCWFMDLCQKVNHILAKRIQEPRSK